jgi:two-component system phosphate regulon sensor histidine kinase PhoR
MDDRTAEAFVKPVVSPQSSLLVRLIFLFGLLVTIPLAVAGVLLSLTGRDSVLSSGEELSRAGEDTFRQSTAQLARGATRGSENASRQLIDIGQRQLTQLGKEQVRQSGQVLRDSSKRLSQTATDTLRSATERMARTGDTVIGRSNAQLRHLQSRAVEEVSTMLIHEARQAFEETGRQLVAANQESMERLVMDLNLERARRTAEQTQNLLARTQEIVKQVATGRLQPPLLASDSERSRVPVERVVQSWNTRLRQRLPIPILWGRLFVLPDQWIPASEEGATGRGRTPGSAAPGPGKGAPAAPTAPSDPTTSASLDEEEVPLPTAAATLAAHTSQSAFSGVEFAPEDSRPRITLFVPLPFSGMPAEGGLRPQAVFVVRLSLDFLTREVSQLFMQESERAPAFVASLTDGQIIAHSDPKRVGTPVLPEEQTLLAAAHDRSMGTMVCPMPGMRHALCAFATVSPAGDAAAPGGVGTPIGGVGEPVIRPPRLLPPPEERGLADGPHWVVVALQPVEEVWAKTEAMRDAIHRAASRAADQMEAEARRRAAALVAASEPRQRRVAAAAAESIRAENQARVAAAVRSLVRVHGDIAQTAMRQTERASQTAATAARQEMAERARVAAEKATAAMQEQTSRSSQTGLVRMQQLTSLTANQAATRMVTHSLWLIAGFLVIALLSAILTARSLVRPIAQMAAGTAAIARGDFTRRVPVQSRDELGALALAFNDMADAVQRGRSELETSNVTLARETGRMQAIVQSSPDGLVIVDAEDRATFLNPSARSLLNLPAEIPDALTFAELRGYLPDRVVDLLADWARGDESGRADDGAARPSPPEARDLVLEAPHRVLQVRCVPIAGAAGATGSRLIHLHDVTREREIDEMKSSFVSLVSHELRTPLTSILGFSSYMLTGKLGPTTDPQRTGLESIHRQAKRLKAIISDFLDLSRIEAGKAEMQSEPVPVADVARRVIEELRPQAMEKRLRVAFGSACRPAEGIALADEARLAQVLTNLLGNAVKFTEGGGHVEVEVDRQGGRVQVHVRDTGMGIPEEELPRIFDRFYQVEKVATRKAGGTGLGLSIVKDIVEAMEGTVSVDSRLGVGTCFTVSLPAAPGATRAAESATAVDEVERVG